MGDIKKSKFVILGVLATGPHSGYDIKKFLSESIGHFWLISYGQIYPILKQLVSNGLAVMETQIQDGKPNRNVYTITTNGLEQFRAWLKEPTDFSGPGNEMLVKLFFGIYGDVKDQIRDVEHYRKLLNEVYQKYLVLEKDLSDQATDNPHIHYWLMTLRTGILKGQVSLQWCDETLAKLRELETQDRKNKGNNR